MLTLTFRNFLKEKNLEKYMCVYCHLKRLPVI